MVDINTVFSDLSQRLLANAAALRSLVRRFDAPTIHAQLNLSADMLEEAQKMLSDSEDEAERAYLALENIIHNGIVLPVGMHELIKKYRRRHPLKPFNAWHLPKLLKD
jgi:hypothetical protein